MGTKPTAWMPLYVGDYIADTMRLTLEQDGAYMRITMDYWRNGPPPDDDDILASIVRCTPTVWKRLRPVLQKFFQVDGGQWRHKRIDAELQIARERKAKAEQKARGAAIRRWQGDQQGTSGHVDADAPSNPRSNASGMPQAMHGAMLEQCPPPSPSPKGFKPPRHEKQPGGEPASFGAEAGATGAAWVSQFQAFWREYPWHYGDDDRDRAGVVWKSQVNGNAASIMRALAEAKCDAAWLADVPPAAEWLRAVVAREVHP